MLIGAEIRLAAVKGAIALAGAAAHGAEAAIGTAGVLRRVKSEEFLCALGLQKGLDRVGEHRAAGKFVENVEIAGVDRAVALNDELIDCDYYRFLNMEVPSINAYCGEFMTQYSWAEFVAGYLDRISGDRTEGTP